MEIRVLVKQPSDL